MLRGIAGMSRPAASAMPMPTGTLTQKMLRQPRPARFSVTSQPPSMKPKAAPRPIATAKMVKARARAPSGKSVWIVASTCGTIIAAAPPCAARAKISIDADPDSAHHSEASVKPSMPVMNTRLRPTMSPRRPPVITSAA